MGMFKEMIEGCLKKQEDFYITVDEQGNSLLNAKNPEEYLSLPTGILVKSYQMHMGKMIPVKYPK